MDQDGKKSFWDKPIVGWIIFLLILLSIISRFTGGKQGHFNQDGDWSGGYTLDGD